MSGLRVIELAGMGPAPFCGMVLADLGADVTRIDRAVPGHRLVDPELALTNRGKSSIAIDLRDRRGVGIALELIASADALIEGFRPGVTERMGLGPATCLDANPRLVYGRMTGWGQDGPLADRPGHDINYTAVSGALAGIGPVEAPYPALNLLGDFGGGGMLLAVGLLAAILSARQSGVGQVVDAAMLDGVELLTTGLYGLMAAGTWQDPRQTNMFDGSRPFYTTYRTSDNRFLAVGALERPFWREFLRGAMLHDVIDSDEQLDPATWDRTRALVAGRIGERTRREWEQIFADRDACVTPVLSLSEVGSHEQNVARSSFVEIAGVCQPRPAPRFGGTPAATPSAPPSPGAHTERILRDMGCSAQFMDDLLQQHVVVQAAPRDNISTASADH